MSVRYDIWLALALGVLGIIMYLVPNKSPLTIIVLLVVAFGLSFYIVWTFPWIRNSFGRRLGGLLFVAACLCMLGDYVWPQVTKVNQQVPKKQEIEQPELKGEILRATGLYKTGKPDFSVLLTVSLWNLGADSVVKNYWAKAKTGKEIFNLNPSYISDGWTINGIDDKPMFIFSSKDGIYEKPLTPLKKGDTKTGVILFVFKNGAKLRNAEIEWTLFFYDYLGKEYQIHASPVDSHQEPFLYIPGIGKPAKQ